MGHEIVERKLYQIQKLLKLLVPALEAPEKEFLESHQLSGSAERDFQLLVNLAIDINGIIIVAQGHQIPDTYQQPFLELGKLKLVDEETATLLAESAELCNILVHEYNFESDPKKFYQSSKKMLPAYEKYIKAIFEFVQKM